jgi:hypothetical protein
MRFILRIPCDYNSRNSVLLFTNNNKLLVSQEWHTHFNAKYCFILIAVLI